MEEVLPYILIILTWAIDKPIPTMGLRYEILMNKNQCTVRANETVEAFRADQSNPNIELRTFCFDYPVDVDIERFQRPHP